MWAEDIRAALVDRDERTTAHDEVIRAYERMAAHASSLRARNSALLRASTTTSNGVVAHDGYLSLLTLESIGAHTGRGSVTRAYVESVEEQLRKTKGDLTEQYKIQALNAQRLLNMTDTLRVLEERAKEERDELYRLRSECDQLRERTQWQRDMIAEKEKQLTISQDEHASLELELNQLHIQNDALRNENSALLRRWLDLKNEEVSRMNEANKFIAETNKAKLLATPPSASSAATPKSTHHSSTATATRGRMAASAVLPASSRPSTMPPRATATSRPPSASSRTSLTSANMTTSQILPPRPTKPFSAVSPRTTSSATTTTNAKTGIVRKVPLTNATSSNDS